MGLLPDIDDNSSYELLMGTRDGRVVCLSGGGEHQIVFAPPAPLAGPLDFALTPAYPNPFNPTTTICFSLAATSPVTIQVHDVTGRLVATLVDRIVPQGWHRIVWDGRDDAARPVSSGSYFIRLTTP